MEAERDLLEDCCGWNEKTWADAVGFAISRLPEGIAGKKVLEIGAGPYSCMAPIFAAKGA
jgi:predicted nicotinamide N-methyase